MSLLIVVSGAEHPEEDEWVIEQARKEAVQSRGISLPPYQGTGVTSDGTLVHLYSDTAEAAERARVHWKEITA